MVLKRRLFQITVFLCLLLAAGLAFLGGCGLLSHRRGRDGFRHAPHAALNIECGACHQDYDREAVSGMPTYGTCQACHGVSDDREPYPYEAEIQTHEPREAFVAGARYDDLVFSHAIHTEKSVPCESCHPDPDEPVKLFATSARHAGRCESCHRDEDVSSECSVCHTEMRLDRPPASHERLTWGRTHGRDPAHSWDSIHTRSCSLCHAQSLLRRLPSGGGTAGSQRVLSPARSRDSSRHGPRALHRLPPGELLHSVPQRDGAAQPLPR